MKAVELRKKTQVELEKLLADSKENLGDLLKQINNRQLSDVSQVNKVKKEIARIKTILTNQEFSDNKSKK